MPVMRVPDIQAGIPHIHICPTSFKSPNANTVCIRNTLLRAPSGQIAMDVDAETRLQHKRNFVVFLENEPAYKAQVRGATDCPLA